MDIRKLQRAIVNGLEDVKAQAIVVFNTEHLSALFERVIIASGTSNRQTKSLASSVREAVKDAGFPVLRTEGEANGEWIIVDCGAAVVHVMQPSIRDYYHLEEIWGDKPVRMKLDGRGGGLVKASEAEAEIEAEADTGAAPRKRAAAKTSAPSRAPAKKAALKKVAAKQTAAKTASPPAKTAVARAGRGGATTRTTGIKRAASRTIVVNPPAARKAVSPLARKAASPLARKAASPPARKPAGRGSPAARKAPARKLS